MPRPLPEIAAELMAAVVSEGLIPAYPGYRFNTQWTTIYLRRGITIRVTHPPLLLLPPRYEE